MRTVKNSKLPFASDIFSTLRPVSRFVNVTLASGTTPPELSRTVPTTVAVSNCANDGVAQRTSASVTRVLTIAVPLTGRRQVLEHTHTQSLAVSKLCVIGKMNVFD